MSISILGGQAKGFSLAAPNSKNVRPTSVLLKRKFFDSKQSLEGANFFDICAGSGSVGLEALSRGAKEVVLVESDPKALKTIRQNVQKLDAKFQFPGKARIVKADALKWLASSETSGSEDGEKIFFFDPPYEDVQFYQKFFAAIKEMKSAPCDLLIVEFCRQKTASEETVVSWYQKPDKIYRQGTSFLYLYFLA